MALILEGSQPLLPAAAASLPTASAAGELPVSAGAGTTYAATTAGDVVDAAIASVVGAVAGQAIVGDGLGGVTETSADVSAVLAAANNAAILAALGVTAGETALPRLPVASALHHWRCDESASPFADLGSSPVSLAYVAGTREYGRAGVYARYSATLQRSPAATDRAEAVVADIPSATDFSFGVTFAHETGVIGTPGITVIAAISDGLGAGVDNGIYLLTTNVGPGLYLAVHHGATATADSSVVSAFDWTRTHRAEITYVAATRTATLYLDGVAVTTAAPASGTMAALTNCAVGGLATAFGGVGGSSLMTSDFTVHLSALSAATVLSRADVCRRLAGG